MNLSDSYTVITSNEIESSESVSDLSELPFLIKSDLAEDSLWLELSEDFYLPYYTEANLTTWKYSKIRFRMDKKSNLSRLTKAFSGKNSD